MTARALNNLTADNSRLRSENVWHRAPRFEDIDAGTVNGAYFNYDFVQAPVLVTPTITTQALYGQGLKAFGSSGGTLVNLAAADGGELVFTEATDNEGVSIASIALPFKIIRTYGSFWFEVRLKTSTVTDSQQGFFAGLVEQQTLSATVPIAAAGTLADANFVGFHRLEGDGDQIDTVYKSNGNTQVSAADQLHTALVADTYTKLGMQYDHRDYSFKFFQNNIQLATSYTIPSAAGTDFPNDVFMGICVAMLLATSSSLTLTLDWIKACQVYDQVGTY